MKEINLEEILYSRYNSLTEDEKLYVKKELLGYTWDDILTAMKKACRQALELAANNIEDKVTVKVNQHLILNTINQIK